MNAANPCGCFEQCGRCYCSFLIEEADRYWRAFNAAVESRIRLELIAARHDSAVANALAMASEIIQTSGRVIAILSEDSPTRRHYPDSVQYTHRKQKL